jgi:Flp pilus assembly pilin Flp
LPGCAHQREALWLAVCVVGSLAFVGGDIKQVFVFIDLEVFPIALAICALVAAVHAPVQRAFKSFATA